MNEWFEKLCEDIVYVCGYEQTTLPDLDGLCWKYVHFSRHDVEGVNDTFLFDVWYDYETGTLMFVSHFLNDDEIRLQMTESLQTIHQIHDYLGSFEPIIRKFVTECLARI